MSRKAEEADGDINEFMEFFKSSPYFFPHSAKQIDSDSQLRSANSGNNQQVAAGNCVTSLSNIFVPTAYTAPPTALPSTTTDSGFAEGMVTNQQTWNATHYPLNNAVMSTSQHPIPAVSQSSGSIPIAGILAAVGKGTEVRNSTAKESLLFGSSQTGEHTSLRELLLETSRIHNETGLNVVDTRVPAPGNSQAYMTKGNDENPQKTRLFTTTDTRGNHEGVKENCRIVENGVCNIEGLDIAANEIVPCSLAAPAQYNTCDHSGKANEPRCVNLSVNQPTVMSTESRTPVPRPATLASNHPAFDAVPSSHLQLTPPTAQLTYTSSTMPVMPALMRTSVELLSLVPGSLLRCPPAIEDSQLQPLNLSRDVYARPFCQPPSTFPAAVAEMPCNNPRPSCAVVQPDATGEGLADTKKRLSWGGRDEKGKSTTDLLFHAAAFIPITNGQTQKESIECMTSCKRPVVSTSILKRKVAPNITVRTLPLGTIIVRRDNTPLSKDGRTRRDSRGQMPSASSPITPAPSPIEEMVTAHREKAVGKHLEVMSSDASRCDRNVRRGSRMDQNNNNAENSDHGRGETTKKRRQRLNNAQRLTLEEHFECNRYPSKETIETICETSGLEVSDVRRWFVNRRRKERARVKLQREVTPPFLSPPSSDSQNSRTEVCVKKIIID